MCLQCWAPRAVRNMRRVPPSRAWLSRGRSCDHLVRSPEVARRFDMPNVQFLPDEPVCSLNLHSLRVCWWPTRRVLTSAGHVRPVASNLATGAKHLLARPPAQLPQVKCICSTNTFVRGPRCNATLQACKHASCELMLEHSSLWRYAAVLAQHCNLHNTCNCFHSSTSAGQNRSKGCLLRCKWRHSTRRHLAGDRLRRQPTPALTAFGSDPRCWT
jgi:hypothetical protein